MHPLDEPENDPPFDLMALQSRLRGGVMCVGRIRTGFKLPNGNKESVRRTRTSEVASRDKHGRELRQTWPLSQAPRCCWEHHAGRALQDRTPPPKARLPSTRVVGGWVQRAHWRARSARAMGGTKDGSAAADFVIWNMDRHACHTTETCPTEACSRTRTSGWIVS